MQNMRSALVEALRKPRYEVIPLPGIEDQVIEHVPKHTKLTVTASPLKGSSPHSSWPSGSRRRVLWSRLTSRRGSSGTGCSSTRSSRGCARRTQGRLRGGWRRAGARRRVRGLRRAARGDGARARSGRDRHHRLPREPSAHKRRGHHTGDASEGALLDLHYQPDRFDTEIINDWVLRVRRRGVRLPIYVGMPGAVTMRS